MSDKPQIVMQTLEGFHNAQSYEVNSKKNAYKDLSTICIVPTRGVIPAKVVQSWMGLMSPMNQKFTRIFVIQMEVGAAYSTTIEQILQNPELSKWKYILTLEEDNTVPPDGLLKLYENMDKYDVIGGLYWTKGVDGKPMCYGKKDVYPMNFIPFMPEPDVVTPCNGLGMGFTLFKMDIFKNPKLPKPFFNTLQKYTEGQGVQAYTQDLKFFEDASKLGYKFACDPRVKVGHYDYVNDQMW
ncbi:hypothetical protein UFOVP19_12 [uncultured Caudovirales phage]|uniref:Glyco_tranf_GTA_type domain containing protein n=1 Tax=uncultured Caudovirales phage TaxID=2100421 RepID=A0A6J5KKM3_9CAUD|nr:hypothetical protein UFOVP19_12 [uncultured Caudovirales phage]